MAKTVLASDLHGGGCLLEEQIRVARTAHADQLEAMESIRGAFVLRLQILKDELVPLFARNEAARRVVDLVLVPGDPPRLWIDMTSYVTMGPDPQTYRLQRDSFWRREILLESRKRSEIVSGIMAHVASHLVEREKQLALVMASDVALRPKSVTRSSLILAWLSGLTLGVSTMAVVASYVVR